MQQREEDHVLLVHQEEPEEGDAALGFRGENPPASQQGAGAEAAGDVELQPRHFLVRATDDAETEDTTGTAGLHAQRASERAHFRGAARSPWVTKARAWAEPHARAAWAWAEPHVSRVRQSLEPAGATAAGAEPADAAGAETGPTFFAIDAPLPWALSVLMGLQHALAMAAGIVSIPIIISGPDAFRLRRPDTQYLISVSLIMSGISSLVQVHRFELPHGKYLGTGMISIAGTSFTFVPIAQQAARLIMQEDSSRACNEDIDCALAGVAAVASIGQCNQATKRCLKTGHEALGAFFGTSFLCSFLELALSLLPPNTLRRIFPPMVTGVCVTLIGAGLTGTAFMYWGGGPGCSTPVSASFSPVLRGSDCPGAQCTDSPSTSTNKQSYLAPGLYMSYSPCKVFLGEGGRGGVTRVAGSEGGWEVCTGALASSCRYKSAWWDTTTNTTRGDVTECLGGKLTPVYPWLPCYGNGQVCMYITL